MMHEWASMWLGERRTLTVYCSTPLQCRRRRAARRAVDDAWLEDGSTAGRLPGRTSSHDLPECRSEADARQVADEDSAAGLLRYVIGLAK
jgi:hypothetical protein